MGTRVVRMSTGLGLFGGLAFFLVACTANVSGTSAGETINITGTVQAPTGITGTVQSPTSTSLSGKSIFLGRKSVTEAVAADQLCALYTMEGVLVGSATSAADGTFSIAAPLSRLRPSDASGTSWTTHGAIRCLNEGGTQYAEILTELSVTEGTTESVVAGILNGTATQAALSVRNGLSCNWFEGSCAVPSEVDLTCAAAAASQVFTIADTEGSALDQQLAYLAFAQHLVSIAQEDPRAYGVDSLDQIGIGLRNGTLSSEAVDALVAVIAAQIGGDAATIRSLLVSIGEVGSRVDDIMTEIVAGSAAQVATDDGTTLCTRAKLDTTFVQRLVAPMLRSDAAADLTTTYSATAAWAVLTELVETAEDDAATSEAFFDRFDAVHEYLEQYAGTYSDVYVDGVVDAATVAGLVGIVRDVDTSASRTEQQEFMTAWYTLVDAEGAWGTSEFVSAGVFDTDLGDYVSAHFYADDFDPATFDFEVFAAQLDEVDVSDGDACAAYDDIDAMIACYEALYGDFSDDDTNGGMGTPPPAYLTVSSTSPADGASVAYVPGQSVSATVTFGNAMDESTCSTTTVYVEEIDHSTNAVVRRLAGVVSYDAGTLTATWVPSDSEYLSPGYFRVTLTTGLRNRDGNSLSSNYTWHFSITY